MCRIGSWLIENTHGFEMSDGTAYELRKDVSHNRDWGHDLDSSASRFDDFFYQIPKGIVSDKHCSSHPDSDTLVLIEKSSVGKVFFNHVILEYHPPLQ